MQFGHEHVCRVPILSIVSMLPELGQRRQKVREHSGRYPNLDNDNDNDNEHSNGLCTEAQAFFLFHLRLFAFIRG
jgi:hypothetical protein